MRRPFVFVGAGAAVAAVAVGGAARRTVDPKPEQVLQPAYGRWLTRRLMAPLGLISFVMTRKMLLGIEQRVERDRR